MKNSTLEKILNNTKVLLEDFDDSENHENTSEESHSEAHEDTSDKKEYFTTKLENEKIKNQILCNK